LLLIFCDVRVNRLLVISYATELTHPVGIHRATVSVKCINTAGFLYDVLVEATHNGDVGSQDARNQKHCCRWRGWFVHVSVILYCSCLHGPTLGALQIMVLMYEYGFDSSALQRRTVSDLTQAHAHFNASPPRHDGIHSPSRLGSTTTPQECSASFSTPNHTLSLCANGIQSEELQARAREYQGRVPQSL
jgi:hypothetical protein